MKKNLFLTAFSIAVVFLCTSCATIVSGTKPKVTINGDAKEPVTIRTSYTTYENVMLPTQVRLKRKHLSGQRISVTSENYTYNDILIEKKTNGWAWGNLCLGGLIGWIVDLGTNCVSEPREYQYYVHAEPKAKVESEKDNGRVTSNDQPVQQSDAPVTFGLTFPHEAIIEKVNGSYMDVVIYSIEDGYILYKQKKDSEYKRRSIEKTQIKNIRLSLDGINHQPSFPCEGVIVMGKNTKISTEVTISAMNQEEIQYSVDGKMQTKKIKDIPEIGILLPNSKKEYNCKMYYYLER